MFNYDPQKQYPKETESRVVIRFQDCDPLRHLNNAKYFDYFFNAREDQVPKLYGLEIIDLIRVYKAAWVVYNHNISYIKPANWKMCTINYNAMIQQGDYSNLSNALMKCRCV